MRLKHYKPCLIDLRDIYVARNNGRPTRIKLRCVRYVTFVLARSLLFTKFPWSRALGVLKFRNEYNFVRHTNRLEK